MIYQNIGQITGSPLQLMEKERIQKIVASTGQYSRREVEKLIEVGRVKVNGIVIQEKGIKVHPIKDRIQIDGKAFQFQQQKTEAILLNKPRRVIVSRKDTEGRKTVYDLLPKKYATFKPIGRLDYNSQGALILTNDGDLILHLTHPRYHMPKVYEVKLSSHPDEKQLKRLRQGVLLDGQRTLPAKIKILETHKTSSVIEMILEEGKNRQIRRMCEAVGLVVKELRRVAVGPVKIKNLRSGQYRHLTPKEMTLLQKSVK